MAQNGHNFIDKDKLYLRCKLCPSWGVGEYFSVFYRTDALSNIHIGDEFYMSSTPKSLHKTPVNPALLNHETVKKLLEAAFADNTRRAYKSRLKAFSTWCQSAKRDFFPTTSEILLEYLGELAQKKVSCSTVEQTLTAIKMLHESKNLISPTENIYVKKARAGYRRLHGVEVKKKTALTADLLKQMIRAAREDHEKNPADNLVYLRDMAILLLGFAGAFRRSELVALNIEDFEWHVRGAERILFLHVRKSKTDKEGRGMTKTIFPAEEKEICPIVFLNEWVNASGIKSGAVFRRISRGKKILPRRLSAQSVALIVKRYSELAKLAIDVSGHSLRSGFVTTAIRQGKGERSIMNQTGHRSSTVLREYFQRQSAVEDNAAESIL